MPLPFSYAFLLSVYFQGLLQKDSKRLPFGVAAAHSCRLIGDRADPIWRASIACHSTSSFYQPEIGHFRITIAGAMSETQSSPCVLPNRRLQPSAADAIMSRHG